MATATLDGTQLRGRARTPEPHFMQLEDVQSPSLGKGDRPPKERVRPSQWGNRAEEALQPLPK